MPSSGGQTCALRSEEHTSELQSHDNLVCRLLLEQKKVPQLPTGPQRTHSMGPVVLERLRAGGSRTSTCLSAQSRPTTSDSMTRNTFFFFNDAGTTESHTLPPPDFLPI